jgi:hypothetical protein
MNMKKLLRRENAIHILTLCLFIIGLSGLLVACQNNQSGQIGVAASPTKIIQPTVQPIPTSISTDVGWQEVVRLGVEKNTLVTGGAFVSTHPYRIFVVCNGNGSLKINFAPQGSATFICHTDSELQNVSVDNPPEKEQINVSVISQGSVSWIASIQMQK